MNFKAVVALPKTACSAQAHTSISFIWIVWSTLCVSNVYIFVARLKFLLILRYEVVVLSQNKHPKWHETKYCCEFQRWRCVVEFLLGEKLNSLLKVGFWKVLEFQSEFLNTSNVVEELQTSTYFRHTFCRISRRLCLLIAATS